MEQRYVRKTDILFVILTKGRILLLSAVIGAVLGGLLGFAFAKNFDYSVSYLGKLANKYESKLTSEELISASLFSSEYEDIIDDYVFEMQFKYLSFIAQMDSEDVTTLNFQLDLSGNYDDLVLFTDALKTYINSDEYIDEIREYLDNDIYRTYIRQLISMNVSSNKQTFTIVFRGVDQNMCEDMANFFALTLTSEIISELDMEEPDGEIFVSVGDRTISNMSSDIVKTQQENHAQLLASATADLNAIIDELTSRQQKYFFANIAYAKGVSQIFSENVKVNYYRIRYSVLGALLLVIAVIIYIFFSVMFSKSLSTVYELSESKNIALLGIIVNGKGRWRSLIKRFYCRKGQSKKKYIHESIQKAADSCGSDKILVVSSSPKAVRRCDSLAKYINDNHIAEAFTDTDMSVGTGDKLGVIFIETVGEAVFSDVVDMVNRYQERAVVLGYIAVAM